MLYSLPVLIILIHNKLRKPYSAKLLIHTLGQIFTSFIFLFWLQGNIIAVNFGVMDGRRIYWRQYLIPVLINLSIWLFAIGILVYFRKRLFRNVIPLCLILLITQTANFIYQYTTKPVPADFKLYTNDSTQQHNLSSKKNLVIIILDTFQSDIFEEIVYRNPQIADEFAGFTYYPDTLGGYPATRPSIPLIMTGQFYQNKRPLYDFVKEAYLKNSLPKSLKQLGYHVTVPCDPTSYCSDQVSSAIIKPIQKHLHQTQLTRLFVPTAIRTIPTISYLGFQKIRYSINTILNRDLTPADSSG